MAYRKTEKVLAALAASRETILDAAETVIARHGLAELSTGNVAARAKVPVGTVYQHFADKEEVFAGVASRALARQVAELREAAASERYPINGLARAVGGLYGEMESPTLAKALADNAVYRAGICGALGKLVHEANNWPTRASEVIASAILAALCAMAETGATRRMAVQVVLQCAGVPETAAERVAAQ